jgi:hypothetical protein
VAYFANSSRFYRKLGLHVRISEMITACNSITFYSGSSWHESCNVVCVELQEQTIMSTGIARLAGNLAFGTVALLAGTLSLLVATGPIAAVEMSAVASASSIPSARAVNAA